MDGVMNFWRFKLKSSMIKAILFIINEFLALRNAPLFHFSINSDNLISRHRNKFDKSFCYLCSHIVTATVSQNLVFNLMI